MPGFSNNTMYADNVDFTGATNHAPRVTLDGQLLIGSTAAPNIRVATLTAGAGISITNGAGSITIASSGALVWTAIGASQTLAVNNGYFCTGGAALSLLLPPVSAVGDEVEVSLDGSASFIITQGAGQQIRMGTSLTTLGAGGSIASNAQGDSLRLVCSVANLKWNVVSSIGNLTIV